MNGLMENDFSFKNMNSKKILVVVAGPTAVGKTILGVALAKHLSTQIISADSRQFYAEMQIGTAKPTLLEMEHVQHHFVGHISIHESYNAGKFETDVLKKLEHLFTTNNVVLMVGGSGLFIDAVCNGFDEFDAIDPKIRQRLNSEYEKNGLGWLQNEVKKVDPVYYSSADIYNPQRLIRALEVCLATGKFFSAQKTGAKKNRSFDIVKIFINTSRENLYLNINRRVDEMLENGLLNEVTSLIQFKNLNALKTVGYSELISFIEGRESYETSVEKIKQHTRNFAKRQITWFKKDKEYVLFEPNDEEKIKSFLNLVLSKI